jgi:hypothetical protein
MVKGSVTDIKSRGKAWDIYIGDKRYGYGFKAPTVVVGDYVEFEVIEKPWKDTVLYNVDVDSLVVKEAPAQPAPSSSRPVQGASSNPWDAKDRKITFLACQKDAIQLAAIALQHDALSLGAAKGKRLGVLTAIVNQLSDELFARVVSGEYENPVASESDEDDVGGSAAERDE